MRLAMLMLAACGTAPVVAPPNTELACDKAIVCGAFTADNRDSCIDCLEHIDPKHADLVDAGLREFPIESWPCDDVLKFYQGTNLLSCVEDDWVWGMR